MRWWVREEGQRKRPCGCGRVSLEHHGRGYGSRAPARPYRGKVVGGGETSKGEEE